MGKLDRMIENWIGWWENNVVVMLKARWNFGKTVLDRIIDKLDLTTRKQGGENDKNQVKF